MPSGDEPAVVLHDLRGDGEGPTVGVCAAIHGNEPTGTEIVLEVARAFMRSEFRGRLLLLPVANPHSFAANTRHSPIDDLNLNRLFPGDSGGWHSEQLAAVLTAEFLTQIDVLIDLHAGGDLATVDYVYIRNAEDLSRGFGSPVLYRAAPGTVGPMFAGTTVGVTEDRGVPSVTVELGGGRVDQTPYVERGVRGVVNVLRMLDVLDEDPLPAPTQTVVEAITTIRPRHGGFLETTSPPLGERVRDGDVVGRVVSPYSFEVLETMTNPVDDGVMILAHLTRNVVRPGDYAFMIGREETSSA